MSDAEHVELPDRPPDPEPTTHLEPGSAWERYDIPVSPHPLGRHKLHDPRSRLYDARQLLPPAAFDAAGEATLPSQDRVWTRHGLPFDQGSIGSCTGQAAVGMMMTEPFYSRAVERAKAGYWRYVAESRMVNGLFCFHQVDALEVYKYSTRIDNALVPGEYPPTDTGSTGLYSMKALKAYRLIDSYYHGFGLETALQLLATTGPIAIGVPWYQSLYHPDERGVISVQPGSPLAGAHQVEVNGVYASERMVQIVNSWGGQWSLGGTCYMTWDTLDRLLNEGGDVVIPVMS